MTVFTHATDVPPTTGAQRQRLGFLLDQFCDSYQEITHAIAISVDGMPMAASRAIGDQVRDQLGAAASSQMAVAKAMSDLMHADGVDRVVTNFGQGWVVVQAPHERVVLIVLCTHDADLALVDDQLNRLGDAIAPVLAPDVRVHA